MRFQILGALFEDGLTGLFLLEVNFSLGFAQSRVVIFQILPRRRFDGCGFGARAFDFRAALRHGFLNGREESPAHEKIKKENDDDRGHSLKKQVTELAKDFHR